MKKGFLLGTAAVLMLATIVVSSCRKRIIHSNAPTPNNVRVLGFTKITTIENTTPIGNTPSTINENYRFYYNSANRVSKIIYTGNDSFQFHMISDFKYFRDTIVKTTTNALNNSYIRRDTFIEKSGSGGLLTKAFTPERMEEFDYYGQLMSHHTITGKTHRHITVKTTSNYTSVNGDFLRNYFDGKVNVTFNNLKPDLTLTWLQDATLNTTWQYKNMGYTKDNYNLHPFYLHVIDTNDVRDSIQFAGFPWYNEDYHFYTEDANRPGDYLQLESFAKYGTNIYRNAHLVESITNTRHSAYVKYAIDAQSKITQTQVVEKDSLLNKRTMVYDIQYETY